MMITETNQWVEKRDQLLHDGVCVIKNVLDPQMLRRVQSYSQSIVSELSDEHRRKQKSTGSMVANRDLPGLVDLFAWPRTFEVLDSLGFDDIKFGRAYLISKPPHSPELFWHQDCTMWSDEPRTYSQITPQLFAMFYLTDTSPNNGCLRVIPGSHRKRHDLHDNVGVAHSSDSRSMRVTKSMLYSPAEGEVDVLAKAGDLVLGDARTLHASYPNDSNEDRTVITIWYHPMFSQLQEATQRQIWDLAKAETAHWPESSRQTVAPIIARYTGPAEPLLRNRVPELRLK